MPGGLFCGDFMPARNAAKWAKQKAYVAKRTEHFRSKLEERVCADLDNRGHKYGYETMKLEYTVVHKYNPDLVLDNGIIVEIKGLFTGADRSKHLKVKQAHPDADIRFVFQRAHTRLSKTSKTTYAMWCDKHGFKWAEQKVPEEWLNE